MATLKTLFRDQQLLHLLSKRRFYIDPFDDRYLDVQLRVD